MAERVDWTKFAACDAQVETYMANGDFGAALDVLMRGYQHVLTSFCTNLLGWLGSDVAADATQDIFLAAFTAMPKFRRQASVQTWLFAIARFHCFQVGRNRSRQQQKLETYAPAIAQQAHRSLLEGPEDALLTQESYKALFDGLSKLPRREYDIIVRRFFEHRTFADLARQDFVAEVTVRERFNKSMKHLWRILHKEERRCSTRTRTRRTSRAKTPKN